MSKRLKLILWMVVYGGMIYFSYRNLMTNVNVNEYLFRTLFNGSYLLFEIASFLSLYLIIIRRPLTSSIVIVRCQEGYWGYLMRYVLKSWLCFSLYTIAIHLGLAYFGGYRFNDFLFWKWISFLVAILTMCLIYLVILLRTKRQVFSISGILIINFLFLAPILFMPILEPVMLSLYFALGTIMFTVIFFFTKLKRGQKS